MAILSTYLTLTIAGSEHEHEARVEYSFEPAYRGAYERGGLQIEPDGDAVAEVESVIVEIKRGSASKAVDFLPVLTDEQIDALERKCIEDQDYRREAAREYAAGLRAERVG